MFQPQQFVHVHAAVSKLCKLDRDSVAADHCRTFSRKSVDFFMAHAAASKVPYQRMIRTLLDGYAERFSKRVP